MAFIETERLILRTWMHSDASALFALFEDPEIYRYLPVFRPPTLESIERCLSELKSPPVRVTSPFINIPTPVPLAEARAPGVDEIVAGVRKAVNGR